MAKVGDITEITAEHPDFGLIRFFPIADQSNSLDVGGIRTADDVAVAGNGELIQKMNRVPGMLECIIVNDMNIRNDAENIAKLSGSPKLATWTVSFLNGAVWRGSGFPTGEIKPDTNTGQLTLKVTSTLWEKTQG
jgi:hypothetical protein